MLTYERSRFFIQVIFEEKRKQAEKFFCCIFLSFCYIPFIFFCMSNKTKFVLYGFSKLLTPLFFRNKFPAGEKKADV